MNKIGKKIYSYESCTSTNDLAKEGARQGEEEGTIYLSKEQTKGRGREGRRWLSTKGKGLYFSIILRPSEIGSITLFSLLGGVCSLEAIREIYNVEVKLKWPNDLIFQGKKLGGILGEAIFKGEKINYLILGFGINTNFTLSDFSKELKDKATSLKIILNREIDEKKLMKNILKRLELWYCMKFLQKEKELINKINEYSFFKKGERVKVKSGSVIMEGIYKEIDSKGAMVIRLNKEEIKIYSGEIIG